MIVILMLQYLRTEIAIREPVKDPYRLNSCLIAKYHFTFYPFLCQNVFTAVNLCSRVSFFGIRFPKKVISFFLNGKKELYFICK